MNAIASPVKLIPQLKLTLVRHIATAMRSAPAPGSALVIAAGGGYNLIACRNAYSGGFAVHLTLTGKRGHSWALRGFTTSQIDRRDGSLPLATLISDAEEYIEKFNPAASVR